MSDTALYLGPNVHIPLRSAYEYSEDRTLAGNFDIDRDWDGEAVPLWSTHGEVYNVSINATGWRRPSGLHLGVEVQLHSRDWFTDVIPVGASQVVLSRDAVPGAVRIERADGRQLPVTMVGRQARLGHLATEQVAVLWRPILVCLVKSIRQTANHGSGLGSWSIELCERRPPQ